MSAQHTTPYPLHYAPATEDRTACGRDPMGARHVRLAPKVLAKPEAETCPTCRARAAREASR